MDVLGWEDCCNHLEGSQSGELKSDCSHVSTLYQPACENGTRECPGPTSMARLILKDCQLSELRSGPIPHSMLSDTQVWSSEV
ncbi:hypothetical protein BDW71DRAFT_112526 [Aspergillus fruticulosus]